jgi:hypothetical protein
MFFSDGEEVDIDDLLDYVQEVINLNIEREKKYELLKVKVDELKRIFKENTLTKLQRLKFTFNEPDIIPSLMDMDDIDEDLNDELAPEEKMIESMSEVLSEQTNIDNSKEPQPKMQNNKRLFWNIYAKFRCTNCVNAISWGLINRFLRKVKLLILRSIN